MPPGTTRDDILDFYISELSPEWQWCLRYATGQITPGGIAGAYFIKGTTRVTVITDDLHRRVGKMKRTYSVSADHKETVNPCQEEK